jgi:hypothetical protein
MKILFKFLFYILLLIHSGAVAQEMDKDSIGITPIMKSRSQIYLAEIETTFGTQKGILYEADSSGIVILNFLNQRINIHVSEIKSLKIKNLRAGKRGFLTGFYPFIAATILLIGPQIAIYGFPAAGTWGALGLASLTVLGIGSGLVIGGIFAILSSNIPTINLNLVKYPEKFHQQLKYIKLKTQEVLIKKHPKKVRLV